jgi:hypothetical protein
LRLWVTATGVVPVGVAIMHTVQFGSLAFPHLWFWLAFVDSRLLRQRAVEPGT